MSYILDALKKIEHEKSRKCGPGGRLNISGDLFQERNRLKGRAGIWKIVLLVVGVALVTSAATWLLLPGYGRKSAAVIRPAAPPAGPRNAGSGVVLRTLTEDERSARASALADARVRDIEERRQAEQEVRRGYPPGRPAGCARPPPRS